LNSDITRVLKRLKSLADPKLVRGMSRFGIPTDNALGIPTPILKKLAKEIGRDQALAQDLWGSGIHEARSLAALVGDPNKIRERQIERWVKEIDSWDVCDAC
jgi:3-methyladenine DNA glycosylase AlkD